MTHPTQSPLEIKQIQLGPMDNYIYLISNKATKDCVVVDPAWDIDAIENELKANNLKLKAALITHGHADHTNGIDALLDNHDIPIMVSEKEASFYKPITENIVETKPGYVLNLGDNEHQLEINFIHTPGHTPGSQCFFIKTPKRSYLQANNKELEAEHIVVSVEHPSYLED